MTDYERNADVSKTLTDKWEKGDLPAGDYWCEITESPYIEKVYLTKGEDFVVKILAPVPSFEQWQAKLEENKRLKHDFGNLGYKIKNQRHEIDNRLKEIEKLKELLRECKYELRGCYTDIGWEDQSLINKIDQALGE